MTLQLTSVPDLLTTASYGDQNGDQNSTYDTECPEDDDFEWLYTSILIYIILITVLGVVLNLFVLMVFLLHKKPCTVAEIYLSNLAAADLVLLCCLPFWAVNVSNGFNWPFGQFLCKAVNLGINLNVYCSIYFIVLISIDRFMALVHPMSRGRMRRPKYAKLACALMWALGFILSVPTLVFRKVKYFADFNVNACFLDYRDLTEELGFRGMLIIFSFIIPISIISFCTVQIIQALKNQTVERFSAEKTEKRATTLILAVLLAFLICWVPFHVVTIVDLLLLAEFLSGCFLVKVAQFCRQVFLYLGFFNSVLNPLMYVIVGKNFRKKARELFKQWNLQRIGTLDSRSVRLFSSLKNVK